MQVFGMKCVKSIQGIVKNNNKICLLILNNYKEKPRKNINILYKIIFEKLNVIICYFFKK